MVSSFRAVAVAVAVTATVAVASRIVAQTYLDEQPTHPFSLPQHPSSVTLNLNKQTSALKAIAKNLHLATTKISTEYRCEHYSCSYQNMLDYSRLVLRNVVRFGRSFSSAQCKYSTTELEEADSSPYQVVDALHAIRQTGICQL